MIVGICTVAKAYVKYVSIDKERRLGNLRRLDTVVVLTVNNTNLFSPVLVTKYSDSKREI